MSNNWYLEFVPISPPRGNNVNFQLSVQVTLGTTVGHIAIDELYLHANKKCYDAYEGSHLFEMYNCGDGQMITMEKVCNFMRDCKNGMDERVCADCDFEANMCQYKDRSQGSLNWTRTKAPEKFAYYSQPGPSIDHTLQTSQGHYMLVTADAKRYGDKPAVLELSQKLQPTSSRCELELFYYIEGPKGHIVVNLVEGYSFRTVIHKIGGETGRLWRREVVRLGRISRQFTLDLSADKENNVDYVAVDDIMLRNCEYPAQLSHANDSCKANEFKCTRQACVPVNNVCDLTDDCGDASDEKHCGAYTRCNFENDMCEWREAEQNASMALKSRRLKWTIGTGSSRLDQLYTGPSRDHTTGMKSGHYLVLRTADASPQTRDTTARIVSPVIMVNNDGGNVCKFRYSNRKITILL